MNLFEHLEIELLQILDNDIDDPCDFLFRPVVGRSPLRVSITRAAHVAVTDDATNETLSFEIDLLASPGRSIELGPRRLHLQALRAEHPLCRGPLLLFEDGVPLPCFPPTRKPSFFRRRSDLWTMSKAILPVFILANGTKETREQVIIGGLNVGYNLVVGAVKAGLDDSAYLSEQKEVQG
jgi:hypothetical protein